MKTRIYTDNNYGFTRIIILLLSLSFLFCLCGCEALRRKFVRKPKEEKEIKVIVNPQEYSSSWSKQDSYARYFLFWQAAHDQLLNLLKAQESNRKRQTACAKMIIQNLVEMQKMLGPELQAKLNPFISKQKKILKQLDSYKLSRIEKLRIESSLRKHKGQIKDEFSLNNVRQYLIK